MTIATATTTTSCQNSTRGETSERQISIRPLGKVLEEDAEEEGEDEEEEEDEEEDDSDGDESSDSDSDEDDHCDTKPVR